MDMTKTIKDRYDKIQADIKAKETEIKDLKAELAPLSAYLKTAGVLETPKRKKRTPPEQTQGA